MTKTTRNDRSSEPSCRLLPSMPEAFDDLRMSVDRFCLLAGLESLNEMMSADAEALCGVVTLTASWPACGRRRRRLCNGRHLPPLSHRVAAELAECSAGDQMALDVEEVVDGRMDGEEPLRGRGRFEPLHLSLSSSHRLM